MFKNYKIKFKNNREKLGKRTFKEDDFSFINEQYTIGILKKTPKLKNLVCRFDVGYLKEFLSKIPTDENNLQYVGIYSDKKGNFIMHSHNVVLMGLNNKYKEDVIVKERERV